MDKNRKRNTIIAGVVSVVIIIIIGIVVFMNTRPTPNTTLQEFAQALNDKEYANAYDLLSEEGKQNITSEDFTTRYTNVYTGIVASNIEISEAQEQTASEGNVSYDMRMQTCAGEVSFQDQVAMVKEDGKYKITWTSNFLMQSLGAEDKVSVRAESGQRGSILDINNNVLAFDGTAMQVGVVPGQFGEDKENVLKKVAEKLNMEVSDIEASMSAGWVQDGMFVPIKAVAVDTTLKSELSALKGVQVNSMPAREYPYAQKAGHLTGYVHTITAEELDANPDQGYDETSEIGATGLEAIYEKQLRGEDGYTITIIDASGNTKKEIAKKAAKNGVDISTTIDIEMQTAIYDKMMVEDNAGVASALDPKSGAVLALVSTPSYNPNDFSLGIDSTTWKSLSEDKNAPLTNRFMASFTPGSTFKLITGAIGLDTQTITAEEAFEAVADWKWQADASWGSYFVTTTTPYSEPRNLKNAFMYSDNLYFAQLASKIGAETMAEKLNALGFNQAITFDFTLAQSTFGNDKKIEEGAQLADTGFGQGKLQMNPLHLTALYGAFVNEGSVMKPYLNQSDEAKNTVWLKDAFTKETTTTMWNDLQYNMESYGGTSTGLQIGGKTGTAEVGDEQLGWLSAVCNDEKQPLAISIMIENTKAKGGSKYLIPMMRDVLNEIL